MWILGHVAIKAIIYNVLQRIFVLAGQLLTL
jgi:hypothetical protein